MDMIRLTTSHKAFAAYLAKDIPDATRAYMTALDAKCLRLLRGEKAPASEQADLDHLLSLAEKALKKP